MKKFRFLLAIILVIIVCFSCLVACDFNNSQGSGNDNESNIEQNNGEIIKPGDKEDGNQTEKPSEPEPQPPVEPDEPEKPVDPTLDEKFEIPEKYNKLLSEWDTNEIEFLLNGFNKLYGKEFFTEEKGIFSIAVNVELSGLEIDENSKSIHALIKYNMPTDSEGLVKYAEKTMKISSDINIFEHIKEIAAYEELVGFSKDSNSTTQSNFISPRKQEYTADRAVNYVNIGTSQIDELQSSRMDDMAKTLTSMEKFGTINKVMYATNSQVRMTGSLGDYEIRWSSDALVVNDKGQLQLVHVGMTLEPDSIYNSADKILDFANWKDEGLVEGTDFIHTSSSITSDKTFGGENAAFIIDLYKKD